MVGEAFWVLFIAYCLYRIVIRAPSGAIGNQIDKLYESDEDESECSERPKKRRRISPDPRSRIRSASE